MIGQLGRDVIGRLSVKPRFYWLRRLVMTLLHWCELNRSQKLAALYKRLIDGLKQNKLRENNWTTDTLTANKRLLNCDNRRIETHQ